MEKAWVNPLIKVNATLKDIVSGRGKGLMDGLDGLSGLSHHIHSVTLLFCESK